MPGESPSEGLDLAGTLHRPVVSPPERSRLPTKELQQEIKDKTADLLDEIKQRKVAKSAIKTPGETPSQDPDPAVTYTGRGEYNPKL